MDTKEMISENVVVNTAKVLPPKLIPTMDIEDDPRQPRQSMEKIPYEELKESIRINNIIQSLAVRPTGENKYKIICGSRRLRAAKELGIEEVPAIIFEDCDDEKVLRLQLLENIGREDLQVMEQAIAFKQLADLSHMSSQDIALLFGKPVYYVRQQLKLNDLIPGWQKMVSKNAILISIALEIASLPPQIQEDVYKDKVNKDDELAEKPLIQISIHTLKRYKGILSEACFDINDPGLDTKAGACTQCPFNTACHSLFPGDETNPRCNNMACFKNKTTMHQNNEFNKAKDDPAVVIVYDAQSMPEPIKKLKTEGIDVKKLGYGDDCKEIKEPQKPDWEEHQQRGKQRDLGTREIKQEFKKAQDDYDFQKEVFDKRIAIGKYKKAFVAYDSSDISNGKYIYVEMNAPKPSAKNNQNKIAEGTATENDINNEITRLEEREARAQELDAEKVHAKITEALGKCKGLDQLPKNASNNDTLLMNFIVLEQLSYTDRQEFLKLVKKWGLFDSKNRDQYYKCLQSLTKQELSYLLHQIVLKKYAANLPNTKGGFMIRKIAASIKEIPIANFESDQNKIAATRKERVNQRIGDLKKQLVSVKKPTTQIKPDKKKAEA